MIINNMVETLLAIDLNESAMPWYFVLIYKPTETGSDVIKNIVSPKEKILMDGALDPMKYSIEKPTMRGSVITVTILATAVYEMDRAVSPPASLVIILEVTPPGQQASIIIPTAISSVRPIADTIENATIGRIII